MMKKILIKIFLLLLFLYSHASVHATSFSGSSANAKPQFLAEQISAFSKKVEQKLAQEGVRVAILARMGRPLSEMPEGMHFTHVAFAVYSSITLADGSTVPGYAIYNLYQKNDRPNISDLVQDYPVDFFSGVAELEAGILIPSPELQQRLLTVIASPTYSSLHQPRYSVIANPYTTELQNCTEFVLDVINAAIYQTSDIKLIKANTKVYFKAQTVKVNPFKLMLGSMFSAEVSTSDQRGTSVTATFEKISEYLQRYDTGSRVLTITP
jgi:hypothetical protein